MFKKAAAFLKEYWRKIFTFLVGLAFIGAVCFVVCNFAVRVYRIFVPANIYTSAEYADTLHGGSVYEIYTEEDEKVEEGSAEFFEDYIGNFIKQDMPDFGDPLDLNDEYMISYGIWQAVTLNNTQGVYTYDKNGSFRIPRDDVEMYMSYCFDFARKIDHRSVDVCGEFKYNVFNKTYTVTATGVHSYLIPDVIDVEKGENDTYLVTVDCYEENMMSNEDPTNDPINFRKRVKISIQDMGIQGYDDETGNPISRYMFLSMDTVNETDEETPADSVEDKTELN